MISMRPPQRPHCRGLLSYTRAIGLAQPYFINNLEKQVALMEEPFVLLYDKKISKLRDLLPVLEPDWFTTSRP
jgi:chaperonin GroEL (HSP60 family)